MTYTDSDPQSASSADSQTDLTALPGVNGLSTFNSASQAVIEYLQDHIDVGKWMATRVVNDHQVLLDGKAEFYGLEPGVTLRWDDTVCSRMVAGIGPNIALDVAEVPQYAESPLLKEAPLGAYVGVPINTGKGELFGTLCALNPEPQPHQKNIDAQLPLIQLMAQLLGAVATLEIEALQHAHHINALKTAALTDGLTGISNRMGWDQHLAHVEATVSRIGSPVSFLMIDLDKLKQVNDKQGHIEGDKLLKAAAKIISNKVRVGDLVARVGGDEFAIAAIECDEQEAQQLEVRIENALEEQGIAASVGLAQHKPWNHVADTINAADKAMYKKKQARRTA